MSSNKGMNLNEQTLHTENQSIGGNKNIPVDALVSPPLEQKGYIYSEQQSLWGARQVIGFGNAAYYVKEIDRDLANKIIIENHYSKKHDSIAHNKINLGVFADDKLLGVLQFGYAMNPASQESIVKNTAIDEYLELNRMWLDDCLGCNSESKAISYSIKYIKGRYPKIAWIQSFADERCGKFGVVYQAANFEFVGEHTAVFWEIDGEVYHNNIITNGNRKKKKELEPKLKNAKKYEMRQFRYIYWIKRQKRKDLCLALRPYPKHYKENKAG